MEIVFYKENPTDKVWWARLSAQKGIILFSFDKETVFNLFADYPHTLTKEQREIFDKENPYWTNYFRERKD